MEEEGRTAHVNPAPTGEASQTQDPQGEVPLPLQNPLILSNLFQLCPPKQLAPLRLVCKEWHQLSLPTWRATLPVTFFKDESVITLVPQTRNSRFIYYFESFTQEYLNKPETQTDKFPHRYLKLLHWHYDSMNSLQRVWDAVGDNIQTLELHGCTFPSVEDFRKVIYQSCPQLKNLRIVRCLFPQLPTEESSSNSRYIDPAYGQHQGLQSLSYVTPPFKGIQKLPVSWLELFSHFPSMLNFTFGVEPFKFDAVLADEYEVICNEILTAVDTVRGHNKRALPFKSFTIQPNLEIVPTPGKLRLLRRLNLPMEKVSIRLHLEPGMDDQLVADILRLYGKALCRLLVIVKKGSKGPVHWNIPYDDIELENLGSLQLADVICYDLTFLKYTPNLRHLQITDAQYREGEGPFDYVPTKMISNASFPDDFRLHSLTHLVCNYRLTEEEEGVKKLVSWMPNMEKLELILNDKQFRVVCEHWRNLKGLKVLGGELTDKGITGRKRRREVSGGQGQNCVVPNITYLTKLIYCSLWSYWSDRSLTEESVFSGFLKLPHLRRLQMCPQPGLFGGAAGKLRERQIRLMGLNGDVSEDD